MNDLRKGFSEEELKKRLTAEEYAVLREGGTEEPFSGELLHADADGTFHCKVCGATIFDSSAKFDSGTGWPSFDKALPGAVTLRSDNSHLPAPSPARQAGGMKRTEVMCAKCHSHLGHVFDDGPTATGKRYCINSVCLDLEEK